MNTNSTFQVAQELLKQIENTEESCAFWLHSAVNRFLIVDENMSLKDFKNELKELNKKSFSDFLKYAKRKNFKIVD